MVTLDLQESLLEALNQAKETDVAKERSEKLRLENEAAEENLRKLREQLAELQAKIAEAEEAHRARKEAQALEVEAEICPDGPESGITEFDAACQFSQGLTLSSIVRSLSLDEEFSTQKMIDEFDVGLFDNC